MNLASVDPMVPEVYDIIEAIEKEARDADATRSTNKVRY